MKEGKIAFIGPREYASVMRFTGFYCFGVSNTQEAQEKIKKLEEEDYTLIFISQDVAPENIGMDRVVILPGIAKEGDKNYLKKEIIKAVGGEIDLK
jgi:vacuolar-type H+-ATPase subunit F/Vma7